MGYWWLGLSIFVHVNALIIFLAILPFPSARQWKYILQFRIFSFFIELIDFDMWKIYLIIACPCFIVFMDAISEYRSSSIFDHKMDKDSLAAKDAYKALFLAQRNYFMAGAAFFLCIFFPRLVTILKENATLAVKMGTLKNATKLFKELILVMQIERNIERKGGVELVLLDALKNELERLHIQNDHPVEDGTPQLTDIKTILEIYENRMNTQAAQNLQQHYQHYLGGRSYLQQQQQPLIRRRQTIYSAHNLNNGWPYAAGRSGVTTLQRATRFGMVYSDSD